MKELDGPVGLRLVDLELQTSPYMAYPFVRWSPPLADLPRPPPCRA